MKLETSWCDCAFTAESKEDEVILKNLYSTIQKDKDVSLFTDNDNLILRIITYW